MATTETAVTQQASAIAKSPRRTIAELLEGPELKAAVRAALPRHLTADRFIRVALNATMRQPELLECTRESFFRALLDLSAYGLEPDGRRAHLIPFRRKVEGENGKTHYVKDIQLIIDYKGVAELVRRSGDVSYIHVDVVYENDEWEFEYGSGASLKHRPNMEDRGEKVKAIYSFVKLKDGSEDFIVMSRSEVEKIRKRSKAATSGPWVTDWEEMAKKTVFRRHSKWLPLSPEVRDAVEHDDEVIDISGSHDAAGSIHASISLDDIKPSTDANRGHNNTAPAEDAKQELKHLGSKNGIAIYNTLPPKETVPHGQKILVRENGADTLYAYDEEAEAADGSKGAFLLTLE